MAHEASTPPHPPVPPALAPKSTSDRETVLKLLESEIGLLTQRQRNTGWTSWAIFGALAALGWSLLGQWEAGWPPGDTWLHAFAAASFTAFALEALAGVLKAGRKWEGPIKRFRHANSRSNERALMAFVAVYSGVLAGVLFKWSSFSTVPRSIVLGVILLCFLLAMVSLVMSFTRIVLEESGPEEEGLTPAFEAILLLFVMGCFVVPAVLTVRELVLEPPDAVDIKVGVLLAAAAFLIGVGLEESNSGTTLENLLRIRRELALGGLTVEEATQRIEFEFLGMRVSDVLRESTKQFIRRVDQLKALCRSERARLDGAGLPLLDGEGPLSREQRLQVRGILDRGQAQLQVVDKQLARLQRDFVKLTKQNAGYLKKSKDGWSAMGEVFGTLVISLAQAQRHAKAFRDRLASLDAAVNAPSRGQQPVAAAAKVPEPAAPPSH